jgi:hypothetical protein
LPLASDSAPVVEDPAVVFDLSSADAMIGRLDDQGDGDRAGRLDDQDDEMDYKHLGKYAIRSLRLCFDQLHCQLARQHLRS